MGRMIDRLLGSHSCTCLHLKISPAIGSGIGTICVKQREQGELEFEKGLDEISEAG